MRFLISFFLIHITCLGVLYLLTWLFDGDPSWSIYVAFIFSAIITSYRLLKDEIEEKIAGYGGLKVKTDYLKEKMDEIQRDLGRNEKSGMTGEENEEEDGKTDWTNLWKKARL